MWTEMNTKATRTLQRLQGESHDISCSHVFDNTTFRVTSSVTENIEEMVISFLSQLATRQRRENSEIDDSGDAAEGRKPSSKDYSIDLQLVDRKKPDANGFGALFFLLFFEEA